MFRRAAKVDNNHPEIVAELRRLGYEVLSLAALGGGVPDLLISDTDRMWLVEVKDGPKAKLTADQVQFMQQWKGVRPLIFRSIHDVRSFHHGQIE